MVRLRRVYEYNCFESEKDKEDLKNHLGDDLYNDYMKIRNKIPKDQNEYKDFQKLKKLPIEDVQDFVDNFQSETDLRKEAKKGAKKIYEDSDWLVLKITTYPAAQYYGKNTTWCITGRYGGHEERGEEYFNDYIENNNLDGGYYFFIDRHNDYDKYCLLLNKYGEVHSIWNAEDDECQPEELLGLVNDLPFGDAMRNYIGDTNERIYKKFLRNKDIDLLYQMTTPLSLEVSSLLISNSYLMVYPDDYISLFKKGIFTKDSQYQGSGLPHPIGALTFLAIYCYNIASDREKPELEEIMSFIKRTYPDTVKKTFSELEKLRSFFSKMPEIINSFNDFVNKK